MRLWQRFARSTVYWGVRDGLGELHLSAAEIHVEEEDDEDGRRWVLVVGVQRIWWQRLGLLQFR